MSRTASFLGFTDADQRAIHLGRVLMLLMPAANFVFTLSTTFYTIFVAEALGGDGGFLAGLGPLGVIVAVQMIAQIALDYPSGALGDWIGQRYVIALGNLLYATAFVMVSFVTPSTPFLYIVVIYIIQGAGNSQLSGSWGAWFDNNYRVAMPNDKERKQYGVFWGRIGMLAQIAATAALIPGSILAVILRRPVVFQIEAVGAVAFALLVLRLVRDFPEVEQMRTEQKSFAEYRLLLGEGVRYLWRTPFVKYVIVGSMLTASTVTVWGELILFPLYFSYLITDVAVASYRTLAFAPGVISTERSGIWSRRFEPKKWIPRFRLLQACGFVFYLLVALMMTLFPPVSESTNIITVMWPSTSFVLIQVPFEHVVPIVILFSLFTVTMFFSGFAEILTQRILIDAIPDRNRNSLYSLQPTILTIMAIPQMAILGWLIPVIGFPAILTICAIVSLGGVLVTRHGLHQEKPNIPRMPALEAEQTSAIQQSE